MICQPGVWIMQAWFAQWTSSRLGRKQPIKELNVQINRLNSLSTLASRKICVSERLGLCVMSRCIWSSDWFFKILNQTSTYLFSNHDEFSIDWVLNQCRERSTKALDLLSKSEPQVGLVCTMVTTSIKFSAFFFEATPVDNNTERLKLLPANLIAKLVFFTCLPTSSYLPLTQRSS